MDRPIVRMVYSAMTEEQTLHQFEAGAAEAAREGYEPVDQTWDGKTLMVTYGLRADRAFAGAPVSFDPTPRPGPAGVTHWSRPALAAMVLVLVGLVAAAAAVVVDIGT